MARRVSAALRASPDNSIRFLWMDDVIPGSIEYLPEQCVLVASAYVSEGDGRLDLHYRLTLRLGVDGAEALRAGAWETLLPPTDNSDWLTIDKTGKRLEITYP